MRIKLISYFSLILFAQSSTAFPQRGRDSDIPVNSIYKSCALYEQAHITSLPTYINADEKTKGDMLVAEFNKRRRICYVKEFANVVGTLIPTLAIAYGGYRYLNAPQVIQNPNAEPAPAAAPWSRPLLMATLAGTAVIGLPYTMYKYVVGEPVLSKASLKETATSVAAAAGTSALFYRYVFARQHGGVAPAIGALAAGGIAMGAGLLPGGGMPAAANIVVPNPAAGFGGIFFIYQLFGSVISDITFFVQHRIESLKSIFINILWPAEGDTIEKVELDYVRIKPYVPEKLQDILESHFREARQAAGSSAMSGLGLGGRGEKGEARSPIQFAKNVLSIPTTKMEIQYNPKRIEEYLGTYDSKILLQFKRFAARHAAASTGKTVKKVVAYFQGPPGVGKTRAAENLGKALNVPYKLLKLGGKTLADIEGDESKPGLLLEAIMNARVDGKGAKNMLILLDELDRALGMSEGIGRGGLGDDMYGRGRGRSMYGSDSAVGVVPFLLSILEPGQKTFFSPYLGCDVDIEDIIFVAAGNVDWETVILNSVDKDTALKDRFEFVRFEGYTPEFKLKVVESSIFAEVLQTYEKSKQPLLASDFSEDEWKEIRAMVLQDKEPGFREVIRQLQNLLDDKALCVYYDECINEKQRRKPFVETKSEAICDNEGCKVHEKSDNAPEATCPLNANRAPG